MLVATVGTIACFALTARERSATATRLEGDREPPEAPPVPAVTSALAGGIVAHPPRLPSSCGPPPAASDCDSWQCDLMDSPDMAMSEREAERWVTRRWRASARARRLWGIGQTYPGRPREGCVESPFLIGITPACAPHARAIRPYLQREDREGNFSYPSTPPPPVAQVQTWIDQCDRGRWTSCARAGAWSLHRANNAHNYNVHEGMRLLTLACANGVGESCVGIVRETFHSDAIDPALPRLGLADLWALAHRAYLLDPSSTCAGMSVRSMSEFYAALEAPCAAGDDTACTRLGRVLAGGCVVPQDVPRAVALWATSCDRGFAPACDELAVELSHGRLGPVSAPAAMRALDRLCETYQPDTPRNIPDACSVRALDFYAKPEFAAERERLWGLVERGCAERCDPITCLLQASFLRNGAPPEHAVHAEAYYARAFDAMDSTARIRRGFEGTDEIGIAAMALVRGELVPRDVRRGLRLAARAANARLTAWPSVYWLNSYRVQIGFAPAITEPATHPLRACGFEHPRRHADAELACLDVGERLEREGTPISQELSEQLEMYEGVTTLRERAFEPTRERARAVARSFYRKACDSGLSQTACVQLTSLADGTPRPRTERFTLPVTITSAEGLDPAPSGACTLSIARATDVASPECVVRLACNERAIYIRGFAPERGIFGAACELDATITGREPVRARADQRRVAVTMSADGTIGLEADAIRIRASRTGVVTHVRGPDADARLQPPPLEVLLRGGAGGAVRGRSRRLRSL